MPWFGNPILVCGDRPIAPAMAAVLGRRGRVVRLLAPADLTPRQVERAATLILADPEDPSALLAKVLDHGSNRSRHRPPLRLILAHRGGQNPDPHEPQARLLDATWVRLESCNLEARAARVLLAVHPLHAGFDPLFGQIPHLLIVGSAPPALALLGQAMRLAYYGEGRPLFTLAVECPEVWRDEVLSAYPQAEQSCALRFTSLAAPDVGGPTPVTGVWIFADAEPQRQGPPGDGTLDLAQDLAAWIRQAQGVAPPIHLEIGAAQPAGGIDAWDGQILPVSWLTAVCDDLFSGHGDRLAQVIHEHYRDTTEAQGRDPALEPAGRPWELLDESYRDASRYQADHLWAKLAATDCRTMPLATAPAFAFAPLEVERLAQVEHRRWAADRHLNGWIYAPVRDNARRHHPQLIPYADLS